MSAGTSGWVKLLCGDRLVWLFQANREVWLQHRDTDGDAAEFDSAHADLIGLVADAVTSEPGSGPAFTAFTADGTPLRGPEHDLPAVYPSATAAAAAFAAAIAR